MKVYLDFDGTVVEHQYPQLGAFNAGAWEVIAKLQHAGHEVILNTYRADCADGTLEHALNYLAAHQDKIKPVKNWCAKKLHPQPWDLGVFMTTGEIFIDDICQGIPLKPTIGIPGGSMVDWAEVDRQFLAAGIY